MTYCPQIYPEVISVREYTEIRPVLMLVRERYTQRDLADRLGVEPRTIRRWESGETSPPPYAVDVLKQMLLPLTKPYDSPSDFTFIDLFAGIGGIRKGFEEHGGRCVFTSEWNDYAVKTYRANFPDDHPIVGDITKIDEKTIPDHDILLAGFPCQPFSIAGVSKKNALGRPHGFLCETQGTLFFDVARIIAEKQPKAFLLENVKNLASHDGGKTFRTIMAVLRNELGYDVHERVIDGRHFVPQHRERIIIVGFREPPGFSWNQLRLPNISKSPPLMRDILHPEDGSEKAEAPFTEGPKAKVAEKYILSDHLWKYLRDYAARHKAKGNGFGYGLVGPRDVARTLSARYYKDGSEILVSRGRGKSPRRLTPRECSRLMGFDTGDRKFDISVSDTQAYKQFGNAVVVPVIAEVARIMKPHIMALREAEESHVIQMPLSV
jgi:DNA (cytosine-5)-methyltransferase 1